MKSIPALPWLKAGLVALAVSTLGAPALAQNITAAGDGTGTHVNFDAATQTYTINGGTQVDANLFHSFQQFGLSTGEIANFLANPNVANILARVTGGNTSVINGLLQVSGGSNANLFILNPAGVLLGRDSSLNLAGSFSVSTASGLSFDNGLFSATGSNDYSALTGNPNGYAFLGNEGILLNEADLVVNPGESITLAGSTVINTGTLAAPEGNISIVAVPEEGLLRISQEGLVLSLAVPTAQLDDLVETGITPLDLPSLLAGDWGGEATTVSTLPDGTVVLGGSDAPVNSDAGAITSTGTIDVSGANGGDIALIGNDIALPEGLIDISGTNEGGYLGVYARDDLSFGLTVDAAGGGYALFDPVTLNIGAAEAATIVGVVESGGTSDQQASETINVNAPITVTSGTGGTLTFTDEDSNNDLTLNLNALISLSAGHTLTGQGTTVNVNVTDSGIVQNALDVAAAGANVNLGAGTYQEGQQLTLTQDVTLNGAGAATTALDGNNAYGVLQINSGVTATINDLTVSGGNTNVFSFASGGILNFGTLTLNNSTVSGNTATFSSGGGIFNRGTLTLNNSTVSGNTANYDGGGGIFNMGTLTLNNSTVSGNTTSGFFGGGILSVRTLTLNNSTVSGNTTSGFGGGIYSDGTLTLRNSIIAGNTASTEPEVRVFGGTVTSNNTLFGVSGNAGVMGFTLDATDITNSNTLAQTLSALADNGGPTQTHALVAGSAAIDAAGAGALATDQRGLAAVGTRDIGAFELGAVPTLAVIGGNNQSATVDTAFATALQVQVLNAAGNPYRPSGGNLTFTAPSTGASLSSTSQAVTPDANGIASLTATANTVAGAFTVTASATGLTGVNFSLTNTPDVAASFTVAGFTSPVTAGTSGNVTVTAVDRFNNTATNYAGTVAFTSSDTNAAVSLPANNTLINGVRTFAATLVTAGPQSITATDTANNALTGSQTNITVNPDVAASFTVAGFNSPVTAGTSDNVTVTAVDRFNNTATNYAGTVAFISSDTNAAVTLPNNSTLTNGMGTFAATLVTAGTQSITATDTANNALTGSQTNITVNPAAPDAVAITGGNNQSTTINTAFTNDLAVTVTDPFGNLVSNGTTVTFTAPNTDASLDTPSQTATTTNGVARLSAMANSMVGNFTVRAEVTGTGNVDFDLTNEAVPVAADNSGGVNPDALFNRYNPLNVGGGPGAPILVISPELAEQYGLQDRLNPDGTLAPHGPQDNPAEHTNPEGGSTVSEDGTETLPLCTTDPTATGCFTE